MLKEESCRLDIQSTTVPAFPTRLSALFVKVIQLRDST